MKATAFVGLVLLGGMVGCGGGEVYDGPDKDAETLDRTGSLCAGIVEFRETRYVPVGGSTRPASLKDPERGGRLGRGTVAPCSDEGESTGTDAEPVTVFRVQGVKPSRAVFVGDHRGLMWAPEDFD